MCLDSDQAPDRAWTPRPERPPVFRSFISSAFPGSLLQGMHEVLAPFVALSDPELPTSDISLCYSAFIKRFLPYAFNKDEEFLSLQVRLGCCAPVGAWERSRKRSNTCLRSWRACT